ncbi:MAG: type II secretion system protein GspD [bacterium]|nr:MAG: type II secretion system protein GspD [bacterium]
MRRFIGGLIISMLTVLPAAAVEDDYVSMDFVNVDIAVVVKYISELSGKNFVIDEKVQGKVTIISPKKVSKEEAYKVFESILEVYGFVAVSSGSVIKIVPIAEARQKPGLVQIGPKISEELRDQMVTQLITLKSVSADNLVNVIRPLIPSTSYVAAYTPSNTLILVDMASNRTRILKIIHKLDVEGVESFVTVHKLKHASAKDLAMKIGAVLKKSKVGKGKRTAADDFNVIADERINALIIVGNDFYVSKVKSIINQLDVKAPPGRQEIHVVYLKNADAEEMSKVINQLAIGMRSAAKSQRSAPGVPKGSSRRGKITVTADKATNSLVITASPEDFVTLKDIIEDLDVPRKQVFVEALIFEISEDNTKKFGIEWRTTSNFTDSGVQGIGGTNFGTIGDIATNPLAAGSGLVLGIVDGTIEYGGQTFLNIGGLVQALQSESGVNILSTPNLLTTDNVEAEIFVGENVPIKKSTALTTGATPLVSIERLDVGILLKVKPQINESDFVKLEIYQEISDFRIVAVGDQSDVIISKRSAKTTVTVQNNQNIVIGGLIKNGTQESIKKVPFLGDIPILGWLFKSKEKIHTRTNLFIFLTPHIINNYEDIKKVTDDRTWIMKDLKNEYEGIIMHHEKQHGDGKDEVKPEEKLVDEVKPEEKLVDEVKPEEKLVDEVKSEEKPVDEVKPEEEPVDEVKPEEKLLDEVKPEEKLVDEVKPEEEPVDEVKPEEEPVDEVKSEEKPEEKPVDEVKPEQKPETP